MSVLKQVVLVGHCGPDRFMLEQVVMRALADDVTLAYANSTDQLRRYISSTSLLLVNRLLDGRFDAGDGIDLIRRLMGLADPPMAMLISNYPDAQERAIAVGAQRGFGKSSAGDPATIALLRQAASGQASAPDVG